MSSSASAHTELQPLPPLPYGVASDPSWIAVPSTWSAAVDAVHEHCREIELRRMTLALQQLDAPVAPSH